MKRNGSGALAVRPGDSSSRLGCAQPVGGATEEKTSAFPSSAGGRTSAGTGVQFGKQKEPSEKAVAHLMAMGFTKTKAERALLAANHNLERAANWLLLGS